MCSSDLHVGGKAGCHRTSEDVRHHKPGHHPRQDRASAPKVARAAGLGDEILDGADLNSEKRLAHGGLPRSVWADRVIGEEILRGPREVVASNTVCDPLRRGRGRPHSISQRMNIHAGAATSLSPRTQFATPFVGDEDVPALMNR